MSHSRGRPGSHCGRFSPLTEIATTAGIDRPLSSAVCCLRQNKPAAFGGYGVYDLLSLSYRDIQ